jgi:mycolipenoyl-CoA---2-(long-chain-fatty acyl)-trehalose mycolipenoyltransferase / long-chain-acyl-CoA---trehalose acyltransferase
MVAMRAVHDWMGEPGVHVTWNPSKATLAKVHEAPVSAVPASYQQAQHLRAFRAHIDRGTDMARLNIPAWDIPGQCDVRAMSHVINAYVRRHDTYHSWFEYDEDHQIVRRTISDPRHIKFIPTEHGEVTPPQWRERVLSTPNPWQWDCFHFGIIQRADHFTFYISVDHVHTDAMFMGVVLVEIHMMYAALVAGGAPIRLPEAGSYDDYCVKQDAYLSALTADSPEVRTWVDFAKNNNGTLPHFLLPVGDSSVPHAGDIITIQLLDEEQANRFEAACMDAHVRFSGGVFACAAMAQYELTGAETYYVVTPTSTRTTPTEFMTTGWFTGLAPITVLVEPTSFGQTARAAQASFDAGNKVSNVPFDRVLELAAAEHGLRAPEPGALMLSYLDAGLPPLSPAIITEWEKLNGKVFHDARSAHQVGMWVNRTQKETTLTVAFPSNPIARGSVLAYAAAIKAAYERVVEGQAAPVRVPVFARLDLKPV